MQVIVVNENNQFLYKLEKIEAHKKGLLHRAFSIFVFNSKKELLLQKRAEKYHSSFLWSNTCCSHPISDNKEEIKQEAEKRLFEEMGIKCKLEEKFHFIYKTRLDNNFIENEYDIVYFGYCNKKPKPNNKEVSDFKYISLKELKKDIQKNPEKYTPWLRASIIFVEKLID